METTSRRQFLKKAALAATIFPILGSVAEEVLAQPAALPPVDESSPVALALGYKHDATKVDKAKFPKYQTGQTCSNCTFYTATGNTVAGFEGEFGKCTIFPMNIVHTSGWCNSYTVKK